MKNSLNFIFVFLFFCSCSKPSTTEKSAAELANEIGFELPGKAEVKYVESVAGIDKAIRLHVQMKKSDWKNMIGKTAFAKVDDGHFRSENVFHLAGVGNANWQPDRIPDLKAVQLFPWRSNETLNVGLSELPGDRVNVYIFWHQN